MFEKKGFRIKNVETRLNLESDIYEKVYTMAPNGGDSQVWEYYDHDNGYCHIQNKATERYLHMNKQGTVKSIGNPYYKDSEKLHEWKLESQMGFIYVINKATGLVLDTNDHGEVYLMNKTGSNSQKWLIETLDTMVCILNLFQHSFQIILISLKYFKLPSSQYPVVETTSMSSSWLYF